MNTMQTTAILVDDEPLVLDHLGRKLRRLWSELDILGEAHSGSEALAMIRELQPDIVFLDIHMPGLSGLDVAAVVSPTCQIVYVTAFDHYALEAFDRAAVDYLLKPVSDRRLVRTITKLKRDKGPVLADVQLLLQQMGESNKPNYLVWLRAGLDDVTELLSVDEVVFFSGRTEIHQRFHSRQRAFDSYVAKGLGSEVRSWCVLACSSQSDCSRRPDCCSQTGYSWPLYVVSA